MGNEYFNERYMTTTTVQAGSYYDAGHLYVVSNETCAPVSYETSESIECRIRNIVFSYIDSEILKLEKRLYTILQERFNASLSEAEFLQLLQES